jgi:asparagine synthase (glutamine-hydrolysing)
MCGFTITKTPIPNLIKHRGVTEQNVEFNNWFINFNSLPLSSHGTNISQPVKTPRGYFVFNGEIFNYSSMKGKFRSDLHYLESLFRNDDIITVYEESVKWDGFWSIAYISNDSIWFFTDWLGKKQLYYSSNGISSEIKPLLDNNDLMPYNDSVYETSNTPFSGIGRVMPGSLYRYTITNNLPNKSVNFGKLYWQTKYSISDIPMLIERSVNDRIENRMDGVSLLLSGGLDSNIILHHLKGKNVDVISIDNDERETVEIVANSSNLNVRFVDYNEEYDINEIVKAYEHPLDYGSLIPNYILFGKANNHLVLTGDGSDELFGGYRRNLESDTRAYDLAELMYYHNVRLDRMSMIHTKEVRSPLMSMDLARVSKYLPYEVRKNKSVLREIYKDLLPKEVINGTKKPLRKDGDKQSNLDLVSKTFNSIFNQNNK